MEKLLMRLWAHGVRSIELRAVPAGEDPMRVLRAADLLWDYGFNVTVHGGTKSAHSAVADVLDPLSAVLAHMRQKELIVTVHAIKEDTVGMLTALSDRIIACGYPVRIALENSRKMPDKTDGDSVAQVLDAVIRADRRNVGICFDMGHFAWYTENFTDDPQMLPPKEFMARVIHTHIHACVDGTTHFPLDTWRDPFARYIRALDYRYYGVYNIELEPKRFADRWEAEEAYLLSADVMRANYPLYASLYDDIRFHYDDAFRRAADSLRCADGCRMALIAPSSYLLCTNGYRWGMDIAFQHIANLAQTPSRVREYLGDLDLVLLTHGHGDHLEKKTVCALADTEITWVVPAFLAENVLACGVRQEKIIPVQAGETVCVGPLTVQVLAGRHFRPNGGSGLEAVGYRITAEKAPSLLFPGDTRDYSPTDEKVPEAADYCFGHVWLTDQAMDPEAYEPMSREMAEFLLHLSRRHIFLTHLYGDRVQTRMWQRHHAHAVSAAIRELSPETRVCVPRLGEVWELTCADTEQTNGGNEE